MHTSFSSVLLLDGHPLIEEINSCLPDKPSFTSADRSPFPAYSFAIVVHQKHSSIFFLQSFLVTYWCLLMLLPSFGTSNYPSRFPISFNLLCQVIYAVGCLCRLSSATLRGGIRRREMLGTLFTHKDWIVSVPVGFFSAEIKDILQLFHSIIIKERETLRGKSKIEQATTPATIRSEHCWRNTPSQGIKNG